MIPRYQRLLMKGSQLPGLQALPWSCRGRIRLELCYDTERGMWSCGALSGAGLSVAHPDSGVDQDQRPGKHPRDYLEVRAFMVLNVDV